MLAQPFASQAVATVQMGRRWLDYRVALRFLFRESLCVMLSAALRSEIIARLLIVQLRQPLNGLNLPGFLQKLKRFYAA